MKRIVREIDPDIHYILRDGKVDIFYSKEDISKTHSVVDQITFERAFEEDEKPISWFHKGIVNWVNSEMENEDGEIMYCINQSVYRPYVLSMSKGALREEISKNHAFQSDSVEQFYEYDLQTLIRMARGQV
jgi:superfamily I DNA and RNA helicase